jgi:putative pyruvate formate lyase activating enzyme
MQTLRNSASYVKLYKSGNLSEREWEARLNLQSCGLCPRKCGADRDAGMTGYCKSGILPVVASYNVYFGDQRMLSGSRGSGAIIFPECTAGCIFARNYRNKYGKEIKCTESSLADIMLQFQDDLCHNINLVSPTHYIPQILGAIKEAASLGLNIPLIYNTGGYERPEILHLLEGIVDIYMTDAGFGDIWTSGFFTGTLGYTEHFGESLKEMYRQTGDLVLDRKGIAKSGLVVRHPVHPKDLSGTDQLFRFISEEISKDTYINLTGVLETELCPDSLNISLSDKKAEYDYAVSLARSYGLYRGF